MLKKKRFKQGVYQPIHPEKFILSNKSITGGKYLRYMSSYELKFFKFVDLHPSFIKVSSEPFPIPYISPVDNQQHRYFPDYLCIVRDSENKETRWLVEIKPYSQTIPPELPRRRTEKSQRNYALACETYAINSAKWSSAKIFCSKNNIKFIIITERELKI